VTSERPDETTLTIRDVRVMRALAHPARIAILDHLSGDTEATATECAEVCGLSPSATSYHLRALAKMGLVQEAPSRGDARERVWRRASAKIFVNPETPGAKEALAATLDLVQTLISRDLQRARQWMERADETEPKEWSDAAGINRLTLVMTAAELADLQRSVTALMEPYIRSTREDPPEGARQVTALFQAVPDEGGGTWFLRTET
jgi:DNA-binding transcriptional ArsR family regulator